MNCPICKKPSSQNAKPFCSVRCANLDLHGWFAENYAIASEEPPEEEELEALIELLEKQEGNIH